MRERMFLQKCYTQRSTVDYNSAKGSTRKRATADVSADAIDLEMFRLNRRMQS